jgi:hypothetical protein
VIRKAIIIVLTLAAVGTVAVYVASIFAVCAFPVLGSARNRCAVAFGLGAFVIEWGYLLDEASAWCSTFDGQVISFPIIVIPDIRVTSNGRTTIEVPLWIPLIVFGVYPTIAFIRGPLRRWRRRRKGLCLKCGYDLTGNVSGRCSECGAEVT